MGASTTKRIRKSPSGWFLEGENDFDVLIWSTATEEWLPGPVIAAFPPGNNPGDLFIWNGVEWTIGPGGGGIVVLAGDANGPSNMNEVNSLTGTAGGTNVVLGDMSSDPLEVSFVLRDAAGGDYFTAPVSTLTTLAGDANGPAGANEVNSLTGTAGGTNVVLGDMSSDPLEVSFVLRDAAGGDYFTAPVSTLTTLAGDANGPLGANEVNSLTGTAGGANVPLDDMSSDPVEFSFVLRSPAGGPYVTAPISSILPSLRTEFDFILESRADLIAAVGPPAAGVFTLVSGSYAIKTGFALNAGEGMLAPAASQILMMGLGTGKIITGDPTGGPGVLLDIAGTASFEAITLNLTASGAGNIGVRSAGTMLAYGCRFLSTNATGIAVQVSGGSWRDNQGTYTGGLDAFRVTAAADVNFEQDELTGTAGNALAVTGAGIVRVTGAQCEFLAPANVAIVFNQASSDLDLTTCDVNTQQADGMCINILAASSVHLHGGKWQSNAASRGSGLAINGNIAGGLIIEGVHGEDLSTSDAAGEGFIRYFSGTVRRAIVSSCDTATTVATAINWASASIPTLGLSIVNCAWDDPSPYVGFTHTSARVNAKGNLFQTGLMAETPIV